MLKEIDLLICQGSILTLDDQDTIYNTADLAVQDGLIIDLGPNLQATYRSRQTINASGRIVMPGLINGHTHAAMTLFRGLADDLALMDWLQNYIFPVESCFITPENVYLGTLLACLEMIRSGTTTLADGYFFESSAARAVDEAGLRGVMAQGIIDFPCADAANADEGLQRAEEFLTQRTGSPRLTPSLFCHSVYTCSPVTIQKIKKLALRFQVPFFIHLSETKDELSLTHQKYGKSPVFHLADLGVLDESVVAVHCVYLTHEEIQVLYQYGVKVVHVPESNMKLASGIAPVPALLEKAIPVGLGTDGAASNNDLDLFLEMDTAAKLHKVATANPTVLKAREILRMATIEGAKVLGLNHQIGSLEIGKRADILVVNIQKPHWLPLYHPYSHLVYSAQGEDVDTVMVEGKILMKGRKILHLDEDDILTKVNELSTRILAHVSSPQKS